MTRPVEIGSSTAIRFVPASRNALISACHSVSIEFGAAQACPGLPVLTKRAPELTSALRRHGAQPSASHWKFATSTESDPSQPPLRQHAMSARPSSIGDDTMCGPGYTTVFASGAESALSRRTVSRPHMAILNEHPLDYRQCVAKCAGNAP